MKGIYTTPTGEKVEVADYDADNKMVSVHLNSGQYKFYSEWEYSLWKKDGGEVLEGTITKTPMVEPKKEKVKKEKK